MRSFDVVIDGFAYLECPRWHDGAVWASDFYTHQVVRAVPGEAAVKVLDVPEQPSGLGWLPDGRLLVVSMKDRRILCHDGESVTEHADLSHLSPSPLNDMVVDTQGRAYVGNLGSDIMAGEPLRRTNLIRVDPDGKAETVAEDLYVPNGMAITPDGATLVVAESFGGRLTAFDIGDDGALENPRAWMVFCDAAPEGNLVEVAPVLTAVPDGIALDAEGAVWVADGIGQRAVRVLDGAIVEEVSTAPLELLTVACMLGGEDGRTLFLCSVPSPEVEHCTQNLAARVLATPVDVPHAGRP